MRRKVKIGFLIAGLVVLLLVGLAGWAYWAARQVPPWYQRAIAAGDPADEKKASDQMEQRVAELVSGFGSTGRWAVTFTEWQVNGWLAHGLAKKHPDALPEGFTEPRVKIASDGITGACRVERGAISGVVSLVVDVYLAEPNVIAVRVRRVRLGCLPWPLNQVLDGITQSARSVEVPLAWRQTEGDPVALIRITTTKDNKHVRIEALQLEDGKLHVAGITERVKKTRVDSGQQAAGSR